MNETVLRYWNNTKQYWNQFTVKQKSTFIATVVILILAIILLSYNMAKTVYKPAFTDLQPEAASEIKNYLEGASIPYEISADGKMISVPENKAASVIVDVASKGLVNGGTGGFAVFREGGTLGSTDKEFNVKYVDALQGELRKLILKINAVSDASVMINYPEQSLFMQDSRNLASAGVILTVKPGAKFDQAQIDTVYNLVSHSVKDLPLSNITVSDQYGKPLIATKEGEPGQTGLSDVESHLVIKRDYELDIKQNVTSILGVLFGPDKVIVNVTANMNFDQVKKVEQLVTAPNQEEQKGLEISLQEAAKSYTSDGSGAAGGTPGTGQQDVPNYVGQGSTGKTNSEENSKTINYEINRITNNIVQSPYAVKDLSITVGIEPAVPNDPTSLSQETKDYVQNALVSIVRIALADTGQDLTDEQLAKRVVVIPQPFARTTAAANAKGIFDSNWVYAGLGGLAALLLGLGIFALVRRKKNAQEQEEIMDMPLAVEHPSINFESNENQVRKQLESLARKKPEDFVNLLRTWLVEE
ncbi:flagellar M-ring protein FliF [Paenibacillus albiflavus]|uniref:Flagellar M-ring protein n=1 Tax=Paenibacillus albiflavus TaxID=2545760 RepID=A0A4R4EKW5_9BACL|nr:flagellar basal-body MS-ring/collar protein FliF [Paenibacillus albiflavus]TCZ79960.1 flagellar M-ring protein FliF [Paenibacillus albiflavus]